MILDLLSIAVATFALYLVIELRKLHEAHEHRLKALERREPENRVAAYPATLPPYQPIDNFTPKKPETLRPNQVRGRDIQGVENVIEFDVKITV